MEKNKERLYIDMRICIRAMLVFFAALLLFSCATTGKGKGSNNQNMGTGINSYNSSGGNEYGEYGSFGSRSEKPFSFNIFGGKGWSLPSLKLPFDLSTFSIGNVTFKEKEIYAGFFGIVFLGTYVGLLLRKIFWKRK